MTRMKLKQARGVQDFNRALALDPALFQVNSDLIFYPTFDPIFVTGVLKQGCFLWAAEAVLESYSELQSGHTAATQKHQIVSIQVI